MSSFLFYNITERWDRMRISIFQRGRSRNTRWIFQALRQFWILIYHFDLFVNIYKITWNISRHCSNATETKQFRIQTIIFISEAMLWCSVISHACPFLPRTPQHKQQLSDQYCDIFRNMIYFKKLTFYDIALCKLSNSYNCDKCVDTLIFRKWDMILLWQ